MVKKITNWTCNSQKCIVNLLCIQGFLFVTVYNLNPIKAQSIFMYQFTVPVTTSIVQLPHACNEPLEPSGLPLL